MVSKIPADDPRARYKAGDESVDRDGLDRFVTARHRWILATTRADGRPQLSPVTGGMTDDGNLVVATYPERAKVRNARRRAEVSVLVMSDEFNDQWVQIDGTATVLDVPEGTEALVDYYRSISGEHPDWDEYRQAMVDQGKSAIVIEPTRWGPVSRGGFPPSLFES